MTTELQLATYESKQPSALADLRDQAMNVPVSVMLQGLEEYADRRSAFYRWLLSNMEQGVHYGVPPGINQNDKDVTRWKSKPSLYKAGADLVCDLMGLREEYESDLSTWEMLGKPSNIFVRRCRLFSRQTTKLIGEGTGARTNGSKSMDVNGSIKMADKSAKVAAILNTYGLSDLFTQDIEDRPPPHANPDQKPDAPKVSPRSERKPLVSKDDLSSLYRLWVEVENFGKGNSWALFATWARKQAEKANLSIDGIEVEKPEAWTKELYGTCKVRLPQ